MDALSTRTTLADVELGSARRTRLARFGRDPAVEQAWAHCLQALGLDAPQPMWQAMRNCYVRTYRQERTIYKICIRAHAGDAEAQRIIGEYALLRRCGRVGEIARPMELIDQPDYVAALYRYVPSLPLDDATIPPGRVLLALLHLGCVLLSLSRHGIAHRDLQAQNVLVRANGRVVLVDFDRASIEPLGRALYMNLLKRGSCAPHFYGSMVMCVKQALLGRATGRWRQVAERALSGVRWMQARLDEGARGERQGHA